MCGEVRGSSIDRLGEKREKKQVRGARKRARGGARERGRERSEREEIEIDSVVPRAEC
jgi:hypothetical protein